MAITTVDVRGKKKYRVRISYKKADGDYGVRTKTFDRKSEASSWEAKMKNDLSEGADFSQNNITITAYFEKWMTIYKSNMSIQTKRHYKATLNKLDAKFHNRKLMSITREEYQLFMNYLGSLFTTNTVSAYHHHISQMVNSARADGIPIKDFTSNADIKGKLITNPKKKFLEYDEFFNLKDKLSLETIKGNSAAAALLTQAETGMRVSEAIGLTRDHIDWENQTINVNRQWIEYSNEFAGTKGNGKSDGVITVSTVYLETLKRYFEYWEQFDIYVRHDFAFFNHNGQPLENKYLNLYLQEQQDNLGIENKITSHGLRHSHGSVLLADGLSLQWVSARLRHNSTAVTAQVYAHLLKKTAEENNAKAMMLLSTGVRQLPTQ